MLNQEEFEIFTNLNKLYSYGSPTLSKVITANLSFQLPIVIDNYNVGGFVAPLPNLFSSKINPYLVIKSRLLVDCKPESQNGVSWLILNEIFSVLFLSSF